MTKRASAPRSARAVLWFLLWLAGAPAWAGDQNEADAGETGAGEDGKQPSGDFLNIPIGERWRQPVSLRLIDIGADVLFAAGSSSESNSAIPLLQGGEHDPRNRGF